MAIGDSSPRPEDHEGGHEDGDGGVDDAASAPSEHCGGDGGRDDGGTTASDQDSDGEPLSYGQRAVQLLGIRANFPIRAINGYDWNMGRAIYRHYCKEEEEVQEEGMVDLVPMGPRSVLMACGCFGVEVFPATAADEEPYKKFGARPPITIGWDVLEDEELVEYTQTVSGGPGRELEITYLVIPTAVETTVEVKLKLKDLIVSKSRAVYGTIKASNSDYGNKSVHLFNCGRGRSCSVPSGSASSILLPLSPSVIAFPYCQQLELHIELDLTVITISGNQEEDRRFKFMCLKFTPGIRSQEREVGGDQVEVSTTWYPVHPN
ncbi:unnamed protein product [Urochloa decumbens]|uniref:DUF6598 domain-containing protein n=1 Tax=Urochloa decumbens TaxID=240449 RepID=A0ABC8YJV7_9POAL